MRQMKLRLEILAVPRLVKDTSVTSGRDREPYQGIVHRGRRHIKDRLASARGRTAEACACRPRNGAQTRRGV